MVGFFKRRLERREFEYQREIEKEIKVNASKCNKRIISAADRQTDILAPRLGRYLGGKTYEKTGLDYAIRMEIERGDEEKRRFKKITFIECIILIILIFM